MLFRIAPTRLAAQQIRNESLWWRRNRTRAPNLFREELRRAFALIAEYPEAGAETDDVDLSGLRRVLLVGTQHYVYYRVNRAAKRIEPGGVEPQARGAASDRGKLTVGQRALLRFCEAPLPECYHQ